MNFQNTGAGVPNPAAWPFPVEPFVPVYPPPPGRAETTHQKTRHHPHCPLYWQNGGSRESTTTPCPFYCDYLENSRLYEHHSPDRSTYKEGWNNYNAQHEQGHHRAPPKPVERPFVPSIQAVPRPMMQHSPHIARSSTLGSLRSRSSSSTVPGVGMYSGRAVKLLGEGAISLFASVLDNHSRRSLAKQLTRYAEQTRSTVSFQLSPRLGRGRLEDDYWKAELFVNGILCGVGRAQQKRDAQAEATHEALQRFAAEEWVRFGRDYRY